jgi:hypothetical protein
VTGERVHRDSVLAGPGLPAPASAVDAMVSTDSHTATAVPAAVHPRRCCQRRRANDTSSVIIGPLQH